MNETDPRASRLVDESATDDPDPGSPSRRRRIVVRVLVAALLLTLGAGVVRSTRWWGCTFPPGDQAAAVAAYRKDPAFSLTPPNGRLLKEAAKTRACDHRVPQNREESAGPQFATVWRQYAVDRGYTIDELAAIVRPDIEAAGWQYQSGGTSLAYLRYCKTINGMAARLDVTSLAEGTPDGLATFIVYIDGVPDNAAC